ncbi:MAG TPA: metallophosphoesterase family protein [Anaeromyxobacteraceae bacterium]|nr:metallophosphoesterase family protein [Anaeromyxobacteraceae bacterium]
MKIGLVSDTYGNVGALERAIDLFARAQTERIFFLGGRLADLEVALARRRGGSRDAPVPQTDGEFLAAIRGALERQAGIDPDAVKLPGKVVSVASRACPEYETGAVPRKQMDLVAGHICCLVHDKAELTREDIANATVLFHGNSGHAALVQIGPRYFVTPGHLRDPAPDGKPATFAMLEVSERELELVVFSADAAEVGRQQASFGARGKMSVR